MLRGQRHSEKSKRKMSEMHQGQVPWNKGKRGFKPSDVTRRKMSEAQKGRIPWNKGKIGIYSARYRSYSHPRGMLGKKHSEETRREISKSHQGHEISEGARRKISKALRGRKLSVTHRQRISEAGRKRWQDPVFVRRIMKTRGVRPTKSELKLAEFLNDILPGEYKYVGDGEFILAGKCPDFVNINGQKKLIELYGDYWHRNDDPQERIDLFKPYGYDTLVVWEKELKNKQVLVGRILMFHRL